MTTPLPTPPEDVLSTLNADGSRRWLRPRVSSGRFLSARRIVGWALIALFVTLPFVHVAGRPAVLVDVLHWRMAFFGKLFLPSDTILLAVFLVGTIVTIFLLSAVLGRVWCGWGCPQTVYMEFLFRPIERLFDGRPKRGGALAHEVSAPRLIGKYVVFALVSLALANIFLSYFVGVSSLRTWIVESPGRHPGAFFVMALTAALVFFDFAWFREQTCIVACPYGRLQSVLLDRDSLLVSYDARRGEPRGAIRSRQLRVEANGKAGDCVDCGMCVETCPTGIDIRGGLRMECIACAQCIDACDSVMDKLGRPRGLIGYSTQARRDGRKGRWLRPRIFIYGTVLATLATLLVVMGAKAQPSDVILLRGLGMPFTVMPNGDIVNPARLKISNRENAERVYTVEVAEGPARLLLDREPLRVAADGTMVRAFLIQAPPSVFSNGQAEVKLRVRDGHAFDKQVGYRLLGPQGAAR
jgi:cytochrome c oxidase accessory protein FixG